MLRRSFLASATAALARAAEPYSTPAWEAPLFHLKDKMKAPVRVASIDVLRAGGKILVRSTSADGATGIVIAKDPIEDYLPILLRRVIPFYKGKDARDIETLVDQVYAANYKLAGQGFWLPVAAVEMSLWDLLGHASGQTVSGLMGGARMKAVPIYLSGSGREATAEIPGITWSAVVVQLLAGTIDAAADILLPASPPTAPTRCSPSRASVLGRA